MSNQVLWTRFWENTEKRQQDQCWPWQGTQDRDGYGRIRIQGRRYRSHRLSWELHNGPIPSGHCVCHKCDKPSCVNPAHLFVGTQADNITDRKAKGRCAKPMWELPEAAREKWLASLRPATGNQHGTHTKPESRARGEQNGSAKLTKDDVIAIRKQYTDGNKTQRELGRLYQVSKSTIGRIIRRENWSHIEEDE